MGGPLLGFLSVLFSDVFSDDADTSATELGNWLVALKDIKFDMSSITKLVEFVKRYEKLFFRVFPTKCQEKTVPKVVKVILEEVLENFIHVPSLYGYYMALLYGSDWLFSCNDQALLARCPRHIQCVFNLIVDILMDMLWSIDSCQKRVSADQCHLTVSQAQVYDSMNVISMHHYRQFFPYPY